MKRLAYLVIITLAIGLLSAQFLTAVPVSAAGGLSTETPESPASTSAATETSGATPTANPAPTPPPLSYALIRVPDRGTLNIRSGPSTWYPIVGAFGDQQRDIPMTGAISGTPPRIWYEVRRTGGGLGWISAYYVTEYIPSEYFCQDEAAKALVSNLAKAIVDKNGTLLKELVSPQHGIDMRLWRNGPVYNFFWYVPNLFDATYPINWGVSPTSYAPSYGSFPEIITPRLKDVFGSGYQVYCNDSSKAGIANPWPPEYANINYFTVYKPESSAGANDWKTWLVGVDYYHGKPSVFAMIYFQP